MNYTDNQIKKVMDNYEKIKEYKRVYYNKKYHESPEVREKQRQASKRYFDKNKDKEKDRYKNNGDLMRARQKYNYYKKQDRLEYYSEKYSDDWFEYKEFLMNPRSKKINIPITELNEIPNQESKEEESEDDSEEDSEDDSLED